MVKAARGSEHGGTHGRYGSCRVSDEHVMEKKRRKKKESWDVMDRKKQHCVKPRLLAATPYSCHTATARKGQVVNNSRKKTDHSGSLLRLCFPRSKRRVKRILNDNVHATVMTCVWHC